MPAAVPRVSVQCPMCHVVFGVRQERLDRGAGKYCSVPCQVLSQQVSPEQRHATKLRASRRHHAKHKAKRNAESRAYVAARREAMAAAALAYYYAHQDAYAAYRAEHREATRAYGCLYYAAHVEARRVYQAAYQAANPDAMRLHSERRRARKLQAPRNDLTVDQWSEIKAAWGYCCAYCKAKPRRLEMEHLTPLVKGGSHTASNIVPACRSCNARKGTGPPPVPVQPLLLTLAAPRVA